MNLPNILQFFKFFEFFLKKTIHNIFNKIHIRHNLLSAKMKNVSTPKRVIMYKNTEKTHHYKINRFIVWFSIVKN